MSSHLFTSVAILCWLGICGPALAQSSESGRGNGKRPIQAWLAYAGFEPLEEASPLAARRPRPRPIEFLEPFYVARSDQNYSELVRLSNDGERIVERIGWVPTCYLITEPEAKKDPETKIYRKVMIVNTAAMLGQNKQADLDRSLPIRHAPSKDMAPVKDPVRLFNIYFVYGEADDHILLGGAPSFQSLEGLEEARKYIRGWVPKERVCRWNTRQAVQWNYRSTLPEAGRLRRTSEGSIYRTPDGAKTGSIANAWYGEQFVPTNRVEKDSNGKENQIEEKVSPKLKPDEMRAPLLPWKDLSGKFRAQSEFDDSKRGRLLHVGALGGFRQPGQRNDTLSAMQIAKFQKSMQSLKIEVSQTEILFIVDDTESMKQWFERVADTFDVIVAEARREQRKVKIGLAYYSDITQVVKNPVKIHPLDDIAKVGEKYAKELRGHSYELGGDPREMVYRGIIDAVKQTRFSDHARKMVIVIGDCGDRDDDDPRLISDFPGYSKEYNIGKIVEVLLPAEDTSVTEFYGIQVVDPARDGDTKAFFEQIRAVSTKLKQRGKEKGRIINASHFSLNGDNPEEQLIQFRKIIAERYGGLQKELDELDEKLKGFIEGGFATAFSPEQERLLRQRLEELKDPDLTYDKLRRLKGFQLFEEVYVWEKDRGIPLVTPMIFLNDDELEKVVELRNKLRSTIAAKRPSLRQLLLSLVKTMAGELKLVDADLESQSVNDLLRRRSGLTFNSEFMDRPIKEIEDNQLSINAYHLLMNRLQMLSEIKEGVCYEYESYIEDEAGVAIKKYRRKVGVEPVNEQRWFHTPGDDATRWFWIDQETEWP